MRYCILLFSSVFFVILKIVSPEVELICD